jgi:hypothetical protein
MIAFYLVAIYFILTGPMLPDCEVLSKVGDLFFVQTLKRH